MSIELKDLINLFSKSNLTSLKYKDEKISVEMGKGSNEIGTENKLAESKNTTTIEKEKNAGDSNVEKSSFYKLESPLVGIFYSSPSPESETFVNNGDTVKKGDVLCVVEAMKMFNEVKSPVSGIIRKINFKDEELVQYGDIIFEIEEK